MVNIITKSINNFINKNRRPFKVLIEFFLLVIAAVSGALLSLYFSGETNSSYLILLASLLFLLAFGLIIFWDIYERPIRENDAFIKINTHTNTKLILDDIKDIKDQISRKR